MNDLLTRPRMTQSRRLMLFLQFDGDWHYALDDVETVIETVENGHDFSKLFRDVVCHDKRATIWMRHPNARAILRRKLENCHHAYDAYLRFAEDREEACLEYLSTALDRFKAQTKWW